MTCTGTGSTIYNYLRNKNIDTNRISKPIPAVANRTARTWYRNENDDYLYYQLDSNTTSVSINYNAPSGDVSCIKNPIEVCECVATIGTWSDAEITTAMNKLPIMPKYNYWPILEGIVILIIILIVIYLLFFRK